MLSKIILASKSKIRKEILDRNNIKNEVEPSYVDEYSVKLSLLQQRASPEIISKNLAELKANKVSMKKTDEIVLGADSVIDLEGELISKPETRDEAMRILKKLNGKSHCLISSVCLSKNGSMIWNYTDKATLKMKKFSDDELKTYLSKIYRPVIAKLVFGLLGFSLRSNTLFFLLTEPTSNNAKPVCIKNTINALNKSQNVSPVLESNLDSILDNLLFLISILDCL